MTDQEYQQKKCECWEEYKQQNLDGEVQWQPVSRYDIFSTAFDRGYALGKQEKEAELHEVNFANTDRKNQQDIINPAVSQQIQTTMKTYTITQHPIKLTLELDDEWLHGAGVKDQDMDDMAAEWEENTQQVSRTLYAIRAQIEASEKMEKEKGTSTQPLISS